SNYNNYSVQAEMRHYFISGGLVFDLGENIKFKPTFLTKAAWNAPAQVDLTANFLFREKLWLGGSYRTNDAIGLIAQWIFNNKLRIGYAYDYSITKLQNYHNGTHEIMISYEMRFLKEFVVSPRYF
ncbi:MAG: PorP/SprF family type IX secretion system membrane protein, partial [Prolixibacteraceae bacterium]|nr:PorP/SprF family type IX secretion system membrane protein [Prolixibacteraceae bacterium]